MRRRVGSSPTSPTSPRSAAPARGDPPYTRRAMNVTASPAPKSSILLEIEVPADQLRPRRPRRRRAPVPPHARRRASAPARPRGRSSSASSARRAILDEAVEHLVQDAYREAIIEQGIVPLTNADVEIVDAEEGKPLRFKATVQVRPEVQLGDYTQLQLRARDRDDRRAQDRQGRRGAARPERPARRGRGPRGEGRRLGRDRLHRHAGRHGVRGRPDRADAADPRRGPPDPGLRGQPRRAQAGRRDRVRHHVPRGLPGADARRPAGALQGRPQGAAREDPPRRRRRVRPVDGRLPGHGGAQGGHRASASAATRSTGRATSSATRSSSTPSPTRRSSSPTC